MQRYQDSYRMNFEAREVPIGPAPAEHAQLKSACGLQFPSGGPLGPVSSIGRNSNAPVLRAPVSQSRSTASTS